METEETLEAYITQWMDEIKFDPCLQLLTAQSMNRIRSTVRTHIIKNIGHYKLKDLNHLIIQKEMINVMIKAGLSYSSVKKARDALNDCLTYALEARHLSHTPMPLVKLPSKVIYEKRGREDRIKLFTPEELQRFETTINIRRPDGQYLLANGWGFYLMLQCGARSGEATAWTWHDYSEVKSGEAIVGVLHIDKTVITTIDPNRKPKFRTEIQNHPKTRNSIRNVYLNSAGMRAIDELRKISKGKYIIDNVKGEILSPGSVAKNFSRIMRHAGIGGHSVHDLRHTYATKLFSSGVPMKLGAEILGQGDVKVYLDHYVTIIDPAKREAMLKIRFE